MNSDISFATGIAVFVIGFGLLINSCINEDIRKRECRIELAKQTKLDTANILLICQGK